jgi:hypothetical protein
VANIVPCLLLDILLPLGNEVVVCLYVEGTGGGTVLDDHPAAHGPADARRRQISSTTYLPAFKASALLCLDLAAVLHRTG